MKRRIFQLFLFLLLGAIINIAVAWGCASGIGLGLQEGGIQRREAVGEDHWEYVWIESRFGHTSLLRQINARKSDGGTIVLYRDESHAGWPCRCLVCFRDKSVIDDSDSRAEIDLTWVTQVVGGIDVTPSNRPRFYWHALPLIPMWPGFAINTIFYGAILWLLFAFPFALRRRRRMKRGLCPACAYPIGESSVCTECGKVVKR